MRLFVAMLVGLTTATSGSAQSPVAEKGPAALIDPAAHKQFFAVIYRPGPSWKTGQPMSKQKLGDHLEYYRRALAEGRVFAGGGLIAINGGLAILKMSNLEEAQAFLPADPAILNGTFAGEVHAWMPVVLSNNRLKR
jgi:uncharacterized protein YciI